MPTPSGDVEKRGSGGSSFPAPALPPEEGDAQETERETPLEGGLGEDGRSSEAEQDAAAEEHAGSAPPSAPAGALLREGAASVKGAASVDGTGEEGDGEAAVRSAGEGELDEAAAARGASDEGASGERASDEGASGERASGEETADEKEAGHEAGSPERAGERASDEGTFDEEEAGREALNRPPLLASEALMEDLAPIEPARDAARLWCAAVGLTLVVLGGLQVTALRPGGVASGFMGVVLGAITLVLALTRITYRQRAAAMLGIGLTSTLLGLVGSGPAVGIDAGGFAWGVARAIAAAALPAALAFRARYRAYAGARWLLGAAFAAALPFTVSVILRLTTHQIGLGEAGAILVILAMTAGLLGFMGEETTSAGAYLALAVNLSLAGDLVFDGLSGVEGLQAAEVGAVIGSGVAFAATSALTSIGLFQILAWRLAPAARRINLHRPPREAKKPTQPSSNDWLT
ncbi:hypothetical protein [Chondromyces crocatus]|uniref:Uncharacterized protein n=1 Tax=Chondromyces crocatus TaxID=52 RepID=A0A0K1EG42_CHOCO|nr:hypothetical protein [Chondromyces crocatus]AKT39836.1 uncharacterized protein CMC5_039870 [Chondromyces crocatus]